MPRGFEAFLVRSNEGMKGQDSCLTLWDGLSQSTPSAVSIAHVLLIFVFFSVIAVVVWHRRGPQCHSLCAEVRGWLCEGDSSLFMWVLGTELGLWGLQTNILPSEPSNQPIFDIFKECYNSDNIFLSEHLPSYSISTKELIPPISVDFSEQ